MIGQMRHRITVEILNIVDQPGGGSSEEWQTELETWADVQPLNSKRVVINDKVDISTGYKIILRWADGRIMDKKRRIMYRGEIFGISGVTVVDAARRFYELICLNNG